MPCARTARNEEGGISVKLSPRKGGHGHVTAYMVLLGSREAREAGFLRENGESRILKKEFDAQRGTITIMVDWEAERAAQEET